MNITPGKQGAQGCIRFARRDRRRCNGSARFVEKARLPKRRVWTRTPLLPVMSGKNSTPWCRVLTPHAYAATLLDPEYGLPGRTGGARRMPASLLAYENSGYDLRVPDAFPIFLDYLVCAPSRRGRRGLHQDSPLLHAFRSARRQRNQARLDGAHRC